MKPNILLIEDSPEVHNLVKIALSQVANVTCVKSISEAKNSLKETTFSLLLLDIELPDGNGINYCSELNSSYPNIPIFILTSHSQLSDKVLGFSAGADDYITKPFEILELKARIESRLKKIQIRKETNLILKWKEIEIDKNKQIVKVFEKHDSYEVNLTALEFKLLCYLAEKPGFVFPRDKVLNDIWGTDVYIYPRSVDTHISKLRKKLGSVSEIIESVHGSGYKFIPTT